MTVVQGETMSSSDSKKPPVVGAVFGFDEPTPESGFPSRPRPQLELPPGAQFGKAKATFSSRAGAGARKRRREKRQRGLPRELQVRPEHTESFAELHALLETFNDPFAPGMDLASHLKEIPLLERRLLRRARIQTGHMDMTDIGTALSLLGNKALEDELLQLLEDMTEVKADILEKRKKER